MLNIAIEHLLLWCCRSAWWYCWLLLWEATQTQYSARKTVKYKSSSVNQGHKITSVMISSSIMEVMTGKANVERSGQKESVSREWVKWVFALLRVSWTGRWYPRVERTLGSIYSWSERQSRTSLTPGDGTVPMQCTSRHPPHTCALITDTRSRHTVDRWMRVEPSLGLIKWTVLRGALSVKVHCLHLDSLHWGNEQVSTRWRSLIRLVSPYRPFAGTSSFSLEMDALFMSVEMQSSDFECFQ